MVEHAVSLVLHFSLFAESHSLIISVLLFSQLQFSLPSTTLHTQKSQLWGFTALQPMLLTSVGTSVVAPLAGILGRLPLKQSSIFWNQTWPPHLWLSTTLAYNAEFVTLMGIISPWLMRPYSKFKVSWPMLNIG